FAFDNEEQRVKIPDGLYTLNNKNFSIKEQEINCDPKVCDPPQGEFTFNEKSDLSIPQKVDVKAIFASVQR
ncbi:MAG: hypothetical protein SWZ49_08915, partial [Cyanobacteriota bacterium]|nr:hypothetical protein [Cyanobacteriota bacterium]